MGNIFSNGYKKIDGEFIDLETGLGSPVIDFTKIKNTQFGLFKLAFELFGSTLLFIVVILLSECISFLTTWALLNNNTKLVLVSPILSSFVGIYCQAYSMKIRSYIQEKWKNVCFSYFDLTDYAFKKSTDMNDFDSQVSRTGGAITSIISWGFPNIVKLVFVFANCLIVFYQKGNLGFLMILAIFIVPYYYLRMASKQKELTDLKKELKDLEKKAIPLFSWFLHLFQNEKKSVKELLDVKVKCNNSNLKFILGWEYITKELCFFAQLIVGLSLWYLSDSFADLLINKVIFDQVLNSIESFAHLSNQNANDSKNFERFLELTNSSGKTLDKQTQYDFEFPLTISASIELGDSISGKFNLETPLPLEIKYGDKILLKGPTGSGKTQFVNSLLGLVSGAMFYFGLTSSDPKKHSTKIEYMRQETREKIPSSGITVRQMLEGEADDKLILDLIKMVLLEDKFNWNNLDTPMEGLSGGERMRLSILYTLWNFNKTGKQILILDEPEQGLDEDVRVIIIRNILESINKPILVIYHGSKLDLLQLPFTKAWIFGKKYGVTAVHEEPFSTFIEKIVVIIMDVIQQYCGGFFI